MFKFSLPKELLFATAPFIVERDGSSIGSAPGFFCGENYPSTIQLVGNTDIQNGDWLVDSETSHRYYVKDARPIRMNGEISNWMVKYQTELDYRTSCSSSNQTTINIDSVHGNSVIGSQENVVFNIGNSINDIENLIAKLPAADQALAKELFDELKKVEASAHPILVEGALSKFSNLIKKHTDLLTAIGTWAVQLLIGK